MPGAFRPEVASSVGVPPACVTASLKTCEARSEQERPHT